ncbi:MAG: hypothetical protein IJY20_08565 [Clostridia bacterium]|nr:hypothetical protein [Clostridia bacterium]
MRIEEIDHNLRVESNITEPDLIWLDAQAAPFSILGVQYDEQQTCFVRMPQAVADTVNPGVSLLNRNTAGGRVRFRTNSTFIGIRAVMRNEGTMAHFTLAGQSGFDLYRSVAGETPVYKGTFMPVVGMKEGYSSGRAVDGQMAEYTINFPLYDCVEKLYIALKQDAVIEPAAPHRNEKPVVYYGSSITQGGCASRPGNCYQAILSRRLNIDYINLGFSGSGKAEESMVAYLASLDMSVFVCDYDHNAPTVAYLEKTHMPLYRAIRAAHPTLPIIMLTAPDVLFNPSEYAPRRALIYANYLRAKEEGDENLYFIGGDELFAGEDADSCTVDGAHPNDLGFYRMARGIEPVLAKLI